MLCFSFPLQQNQFCKVFLYGYCFVHGKFQEHNVDLNAFNQSLIFNALNHRGDAESNLRFWYMILSSEVLLS